MADVYAGFDDVVYRLYSFTAQDLAPPSDRDVWQIGRQELEFLNTFQPNPQGFLTDAYVQYRGTKDEVLSDTWSVGRILWRPNGTTVTDLPLPQEGAPLPSTDGSKQKIGFFFFHKPAVSSPAPEPGLRLARSSAGESAKRSLGSDMGPSRYTYAAQ